MSSVNSVFYADAYHPIQVGSIDETNTLPHDNAVYRALLCSNAGLYDPFDDLKVTGYEQTWKGKKYEEWSMKHVLGFIEKAEELKSKGVDEFLCISEGMKHLTERPSME